MATTLLVKPSSAGDAISEALYKRSTAPMIKDPNLRVAFHQAEKDTISTQASYLADKLGSILGSLGQIHQNTDGWRHTDAKRKPLKAISTAFDLKRGSKQLLNPSVRRIIECELEDQDSKRYEDGRSGQGVPDGISFMPGIDQKIGLSLLRLDSESPGPQSLYFLWSSNGFFDGRKREDLPEPKVFAELEGDWGKLSRPTSMDLRLGDERNGSTLKLSLNSSDTLHEHRAYV
ncbi:hypothetical protein IAU59_004786 [Kwoniella sp. CBS 9459]